MVERRVVNTIDLINKLNSMRYQYISELQMHHLFLSLGYTIQIEEEEDKKDELQAN